MNLCNMCRNIMEQTFDIKLPAIIKSNDAVSSSIIKSLQLRPILSTSTEKKGSNSNQSNSDLQSPESNNSDEETDEFDYSNYKGYFGKGRPVTVYAQFIHANKHRYDEDFYEYVTMCAKIWKKLPPEQREIFVDASRRDVIRYRTGKKIPRQIKSVKTVTSRIPDGPIKRKITRSLSKDSKGTPSKKRRLSTPKPKATAKKIISKASRAKKRASSPAKKRSSSPAKKRASSPAKKKAPSPKKKRMSTPKKKTKSSPKKKRVISTKAKSSSLKKKKFSAKSRLKRKSKVVKKSKQKLKNKKSSRKKGSVASKGKDQSKVASKPGEKSSEKSLMPFSCISKWWNGKTYDYSNYKPYYGKNGFVSTYAQFVHANGHHAHGEIKPYFAGCAKIWKKLSPEQKAIFEKASRKDYERFRKTATYRAKVKKHKK